MIHDLPKPADVSPAHDDAPLHEALTAAEEGRIDALAKKAVS